jgi:hypothetical protein
MHHRSEPINMNFVESSLTLFRRVLGNPKVSRHAWLEGKVESNQIQKFGDRGQGASGEQQQTVQTQQGATSASISMTRQSAGKRNQS